MQINNITQCNNELMLSDKYYEKHNDIKITPVSCL